MPPTSGPSPTPAPAPTTDFTRASVEAFLASLAAKTPTPGGGAAACVAGALSASLAGMVVAYSIGKKNLAEHDGLLRDAAHRLERARALLLGLSAEDEAAYGLVNELMKLPADDARRLREMPAAAAMAIAAPSAVLAAACDLLRLYDELATRSNRMLRSDLGIAAELALAAARASVWNVGINAGLLDEAARAAVLKRTDETARTAAELRDRVAASCRV